MVLPPTSSLQAIQTKVRRLTRTPSTQQLTDDDLNNYINTFVVYDFPEHLRMFNLKTVFKFWCNPYQDVYITDSTLPITNPLYNFQQNYISIEPPLYIAGFQSLYSQSREQFFGIYPLINSILSIGLQGNGAQTVFTGNINTSGGPNFVNPTLSNQTTTLLQNNVLFSSVDLNNNGLSLIDVPIINAGTGNPTVNGNLYVPGQTPITPPTVIDPTNTVNYITGNFTITFPTAPGVGQAINSQCIPQVIGLPQAMLWYDNQFTLRPVPDQPYQINFEAYARPTAILQTNPNNQGPQLQEWWQYIAYGAAKKIFEDRMDMESVSLILPEYRKQENLCLRRTLVQYTNERTATIYTEQTSFGAGSGGWGWGSGL